MVGTRGKGKASAAKSKGKAASAMSAVPEPVVAEESSEFPSNGENKLEVPSTGEKENNDQKAEVPSTDKKENDDTTSGLVVGNGSEANQQLADDGNDDELENDDDEPNGGEKDDTDELIVNEDDYLSEEPEEDNDDDDDDDEADDVEYENDGEDAEEEEEEEDIEGLSDDGDAVNNADGEDNEGKPDEEVKVEDKEPITEGGGDENVHTEEENKDTEVAKDGKVVNGEGLAASEHGLIDETISKEASAEANAEEPKAEERENVSNGNNDKASTEEAKKPKKKIIKKKVIKKVRKNNAASNNEAKPQSIDASGNRNSAEADKHEMNDEKAETKQSVDASKNQNQKRKPVVSESNAADGQKTEPTNIEQGTEVGGEKAEKLGKKANHLKRKRKQKAKKNETTGDVVTGDTNKPGPSSEKGQSKKVESMGMIFMCSSETKKDCYRYKVLGLPAAKKEFVAKIYKGMRLFLFDVKQRMLYGIYKAAAPGGFNLEPRAFKSKFPSQVRFTVIKECVPLPEEKFKRVIKKNYYTKNKFNCKLTNEQVKELCKLFHENNKKGDSSSRIVRNPVEATPSSSKRGQTQKGKRKRTEEGYKAGPTSKRERRPTHREPRRAPPAHDDRYYQRPPVVYQREPYLPPPAPPVQVVYQPIPTYSYVAPARDDMYRREPARSSLREVDRREPYATYRDSRGGSYLEPVYETGIRRDLYEASSSRRDAYEPPSAPRRDRYEYASSDARRVEYYSAAPEYRAPLPPYRRY